MDLVSKKCEPCEGGTPLTKEQAIEYLSDLKATWEMESDKKIKSEFEFGDFKQAITFVDKIADIAESEGHHPDIHIFYNKVLIELWTHAVNGLSENDFILAAKIEKVYSERS
jgi:4a-hydroxytetrahydrobiopterin dehydratase